MKIKKINESLVSIIGESSEIDIIRNLCRALIPNANFIPAIKMGLKPPYKEFCKLNPRNDNEIFVMRGLVNSIVKNIKENYPKILIDLSEYEDLSNKRKEVTKEEVTNFIVNELKIPFTPHPFQVEAIRDAINNDLRIMVLATGSGKSLIIYCLLRYFMKYIIPSDDEKIILIVPSIMLLSQMYSDFESYGFTNIENYVDRLGGDFKIKFLKKKITITTYQSLIKNTDLLEEVSMVIEDEVHLAKSETHETIIYPNAINAKYRYGLTGSLPRDMCSKMSLTSIFGNSKKYVSPRTLIDMGLATDLRVVSMFLKHPESTSSILRNTKNYNKEVSTLLSLDYRTNAIAKLISKISEKGNTIVLFNRVEFGEKLALSTMREKFGIELKDVSSLRKLNDYNVYYISGSSKSFDREMIRKVMEDREDAIIIGTTSLISTGINIPKLHSMVLASGTGKSDITLTQSIGRLLRKHNSKNSVTLFDIVDLATPLNGRTYKTYSYKHFLERLEVYTEQEYPIKEIEVVL